MDEAVGPDLRRADPSRMYDYYLGGASNLAVDRQAAEKVLAVLPEVREVSVDNRAFLRRVVRYLVTEVGVTQFLDLGSGIPTMGSVHEITQRVNPACRVVYVDHEPIAVARTKKLLLGNDNATIIDADVRRPAELFAQPEVHRLLDFDHPIAVLALQLVPYMSDAERPAELIAHYRDACPVGSYLAIAHILAEEYWPPGVHEALKVYDESTNPLHLRDPQQVRAMFDGYQLVEPGVVFAAAWRPEQLISPERARRSRSVVGLGRRI